MKRSWSVAALTLALFAASELAIHADVRTDRKTRFELAGALGRMVNMFSRTAREGVTSTVAVKGNRKITLTESTGEIIDLAEEKVYTLDIKKKTYKVTTFAERYKLGEFGLGFMRLALETNTPIVPIGVVGAEEQSPALVNVKPIAKLLGFPVAPLTVTGVPLIETIVT